MKIQKRDIIVLLFVYSVAALFIMYNMYVKPQLEEIDKVNASIASLKTQVKDLEDKEQKVPALNEEIDSMETEIIDLVSIYPENITEEDVFYYVSEVNREVDMKVKSVSFSNPSDVFSIVGQSGENSYNMMLKQMSVNVDYTTDYEGFKKIVDYINEDPDHRNIQSVSISIGKPDTEKKENSETEGGEVNEEEAEADPNAIKLSGSFSLTLYCLNGKITDKEPTERYEKVTFDHGVDVIFAEPNRE